MSPELESSSGEGGRQVSQHPPSPEAPPGRPHINLYAYEGSLGPFTFPFIVVGFLLIIFPRLSKLKPLFFLAFFRFSPNCLALKLDKIITSF